MPVEKNDKIPKYAISFGRRRVRSLRLSQQELFETLLPEITVPEEGAEKLFPQKKTLFIEIGYGAGEHLAQRAAENPDAGFIGCEVFINGIGACLRHIEKNALKNVRLFTKDARLLLERLPKESVDGIYILFPDPWPKARHHRRRIVNHQTLDMLHGLLKPKGFLQLATDDISYLRWMLCRMLERKDFIWQAKSAKDWDTPAGHPPTRYQQKALKKGRRAFFLRYIK